MVAPRLIFHSSILTKKAKIIQLRATEQRCEEKYVRVIARELAIALNSIHEANIIHRDLKGLDTSLFSM